MQDEYATIIQDQNDYDAESAGSDEEQSESEREMKVSVVKPKAVTNLPIHKIGNPKGTVGISPIRRSANLNDIGMDDPPEM